MKLGMPDLWESMLLNFFLQFRVFIFDPIPKIEMAESAESFLRFLPTLLVIFTDYILIIRNLKRMLLHVFFSGKLLSKNNEVL